MLYIDFETRSTANIKLGLARYVPQSEVLCLAYAFDDEQPSIWTPTDPIPKKVVNYILDGGMVSAFNAMFEYCVWNHHKLFGIELQLEQIKDTMLQCCIANVPQNLGDAAIALGLSQEKDKRGEYLIRHLCVPRKPTKTNPEIWFEEPELYQELYDYCKQDVRTERALSQALPELTKFDYDMWVLTAKINLRGLPIDTLFVQRMVKLIDENQKRMLAQGRELCGFNLTQVSKVKEFLGTANCQVETLAALIEDNDVDEIKKTVARLRMDIGSTAVKKYSKILEILAPDDTVKHTLVYNGAGATGRFASRGGLNIQNLARPRLYHDQNEMIEFVKRNTLDKIIEKYGSFVDVAVSCVRGVIYRKEGFIDTDFSSIENRVCSWMVNDKETLDKFANGLDQYKDICVDIFGVKYEDVTKDQRQIGKVPILGGSFGMGAVGLKQFGEGIGVQLTLEEATNLVNTFRTKYPKIAKAWKQYDGAAKTCVYTGEPVDCLNVRFSIEPYSNIEYLTMLLPSGKKLYYAQPRISRVQTPWGAESQSVTAITLNALTRKYERSAIIGSVLYQNSVQAEASQLLKYAMLRMDDAGVNIRTCVHDEVFADTYDEVKFNDLMRAVPSWANGMVIDTESWTDTRFRK